MNRLQNLASGVMGSLGRMAPLLLAFAVGLFWAYNLAPAQFYDAHPSQLSQSWQDNWVTLVNDRYVSANADSGQLRQLLIAVDAPDEIAGRLKLSPGMQELARQAAPTAALAPARGSLVNDVLNAALQVALFGALLMLLQFGRGPARAYLARRGDSGLAPGGWRLPGLRLPSLRLPRLRLPFRRSAAASAAPMAMTGAPEMAGAQATAVREPAGRVSTRAALGPMLRQETRFSEGMGEYDESFAIEDEYDNFLGECGAAVTETIGVNDPRAAAIEVWLFDKEDFVRTLTHVFASQHAINDPAMRERLQPKVADGALLLAQPGATTVLETRALRMEARITELEYGRDDLPPNSHFAHFDLELRVFRKEGAALGTTPAGATATGPLAPEPMVETAGNYPDPFDGGGDFSPVG